LSQIERYKFKNAAEKELEEQAHRLKVFLEIISEADFLLLKRLAGKRKDDKTEEGNV